MTEGLTSFCPAFLAFRYDSLLEETRNAASQVAQILEKAEALIVKGGTPPPMITKAIGLNLIADMKSVVDYSWKLGARLEDLRAKCSQRG